MTTPRTPKVIQIPVTEDKGYTLVSNHVLVQPDGKRHGLGCCARGDAGRQQTGGTPVPGPWAYAFGLSICITANPELSTGAEVRRNRAAGIEHDVEEGDRIVFDRTVYRIRFTDGFGGTHGRREYIRLDLVEDLAPEETAALAAQAQARAEELVAAFVG